MKKVIKLTESDLTRIIQRVVSEQQAANQPQTGTQPQTGAQPKIQPPTGNIPTTTPNLITIKPTIEIDCTKRVINNSQLPKLDKTANFTIINHYCSKYKK